MAKKKAKKSKKVQVKASSRLGKKRAAWKSQLKKHKKDRSYYVKYFVEVNGKRIPLKDAYRAIFETNKSNDALDSTRIRNLFEELEIPVYEIA